MENTSLTILCLVWWYKLWMLRFIEKNKFCFPKKIRHKKDPPTRKWIVQIVGIWHLITQIECLAALSTMKNLYFWIYCLGKNQQELARRIQIKKIPVWNCFTLNTLGYTKYNFNMKCAFKIISYNSFPKHTNLSKTQKLRQTRCTN